MKYKKSKIENTNKGKSDDFKVRLYKWIFKLLRFVKKLSTETVAENY